MSAVRDPLAAAIRRLEAERVAPPPVRPALPADRVALDSPAEIEARRAELIAADLAHPIRHRSCRACRVEVLARMWLREDRPA